MNFLNEADVWIKEVHGQERVFMHNPNGEEKSFSTELFKVRFPSSLYVEPVQTISTVKYISYLIGLGGQYYDRIITTQNALGQAKQTGGLKYEAALAKKTDAVMKYFGEKTEYYLHIPYNSGDPEKNTATIRLSNHTAQHEKSKDACMVSIVIPEGSFTQKQVFNLNSLQNGNFEFVAGIDFEYDGRAFEFAQKLKKFIKDAKEKGFDASSLLEVLKSGNKSKSQNTETAKVEEIYDDDYMNLAASIFNEDPKNITRDQYKMIRYVISYKADILKYGMKSAPKFNNTKGHAFFWKIFKMILKPSELKIFIEKRREADRENYKHTKHAPKSKNMSKESNWPLFYKLVTELIDSPDFKPMSIYELTDYLNRRGYDKSWQMVYRYIHTYNNENPDKPFKFKNEDTLRRGKDKEFEKLILDYLDGATEGDFSFPISTWIEYLKSVGFPISKQSFYKYMKKMQEKYPKLKLTAPLSDHVDKVKDEIKKEIYNYASKKYNRKMSGLEWENYIKAFGYKLSRPTIIKIIREVEKDHPELGVIIPESITSKIKEFLKSNPELLDKPVDSIKNALDRRGMSVDLSTIRKIVNKLKQKNESYLFYDMMDELDDLFD